MAFYSYATFTMPWLYPYAGPASTPWFYPFSSTQTVFTLFGQPATPATLFADSTDYTYGLQFTVSESCTLTAIWFYSAPGATSLPVTIALYAVTGATLIQRQGTNGTPTTWSGAAGSGWVRSAFASPSTLATATSYKGCILDNSASSFYAPTSHYWDTGPGSGGLTTGPITAPNNAGADGGQDSFFQGSSVLNYPNSSFNATNYWVDVEVTV